MSGHSRRTEIRIETHEVEVVRSQKRQALAICERCGEIVTALIPEVTAVVVEMSQELVFRLLDDGRVHLASADHDMTLICGDSVATTMSSSHEKH